MLYSFPICFFSKIHHKFCTTRARNFFEAEPHSTYRPYNTIQLKPNGPKNRSPNRYFCNFPSLPSPCFIVNMSVSNPSKNSANLCNPAPLFFSLIILLQNLYSESPIYRVSLPMRFVYRHKLSIK